ncbi:MAG: hypothetical protein ACJAV6_000615 [Candidatus Paceibacteria bacterium]|jgi:hypothetical protein
MKNFRCLFVVLFLASYLLSAQDKKEALDEYINVMAFEKALKQDHSGKMKMIAFRVKTLLAGAENVHVFIPLSTFCTSRDLQEGCSGCRSTMNQAFVFQKLAKENGFRMLYVNPKFPEDGWVTFTLFLKDGDYYSNMSFYRFDKNIGLAKDFQEALKLEKTHPDVIHPTKVSTAQRVLWIEDFLDSYLKKSHSSLYFKQIF